MLYELPISNVRLSACHVPAEQLTPVAGGHFCASCQRTVQDFTQASAAELARAQAAAPDGRVCGRFRLSQLAPESRPAPLRLRPRLRQFLLAAVLVLAQGLSARQAWAQLQPRPVAPFRPAATAPLYQLPGSLPAPVAPDTTKTPEPTVFGGMMEVMPVPPGGMEGLLQFLGQHLRYPATTTVEGKVFVNFIVQRDGQLTDFRVLKGLDPVLDAEALRVLKLMPRWTPGQQNHRPVAVRYTLPVTFRRDAPPATRQ
ncbi:energy transducer TonB [Hymenobacter gummosus]|uniref:Energy transducer TonB n=1 Tax=Hymenobacter gummosus TaxID=1776032 RepID=A0A431TYN6_9BACT|nr:energy transducer TonB [Hymenobacter gummosus]RTQ47151.1 energy transducer TonB [Hymenobacter gummosus]